MRLAITVFAGLLLASSAYAATVTVSPDNMQGWATAVNKNGLCYFTGSGPVKYETATGFASGKGAFYALCMSGGTSTADKTPDTVWLGLDTFNGQPLAGIKLSQIKTMQYTCYVSDMPTMNMSAPFGIVNEWKYPREPICLQFVVTGPDGRKNIWFRPWSNDPQGHGYGGSPATQMGQWVTYDCVNCTSQAAGVTSSITPMWNEPVSNQKFLSWASVCNSYGDYTLVATSTTFDTANGQYKSAGWDGKTEPVGSTTSTGTGMALNFEVGARKYAYKDIWGHADLQNWYPESINFRGYVDTFKLGVDYGTPESPNVVETTFDFEPAAATATPDVVACNLRSLCEGVLNVDGSATVRSGYAGVWENSSWKRFVTRACGMTAGTVQQVNEGAYSEDHVSFTSVYCNLTDGSSNIPVPVIARAKDPDGALFAELMWGGNYVGITADVRRRPTGLVKERWLWGTGAQTVNYGHP